MQITKLKINNYLCLVDFQIKFQIDNHGSLTVLIGENGTGKSTMLDAILEILMSFDSPIIEKRIGYAYEIEYKYAQINHIIKKEGHNYIIQIGVEKFIGNYSTIKKLLSKKRIFPERIIAFYSGANNKLIDKIQHQNTLYASKCRYALRNYLHSLENPSLLEEINFPKRKYNYCDETLTPIYLASLLAGNSSFEKKYLQNNCIISSLEMIVVSVDLKKINKISLNTYKEDDNFIKFQKIVSFIDNRFLVFFQENVIDNISNKSFFVIKELETKGIDSIAILEFFEKLYSLFDAEFHVYVTVGEQEIEVSQMSEGQRQLIKILGMLGISKSEDCLVLMDEPDAHMNPTWKYEVKKTIDNCLKSTINTQAIIATHDPLVINGVPKEYIRIFTLVKDSHQNSYITKVINPTEDTKGLGIDGLLQSEYYGLTTVLDTETRKIMDRKNDLLVKQAEGHLSEPEKEELEKLSNQLEDMYFARNIPTDEYYDEYIAAMHRIYKRQHNITLSQKEIEERNANAENILRKLLGK